LSIKAIKSSTYGRRGPGGRNPLILLGFSVAKMSHYEEKAKKIQKRHFRG
jgi:hypothetical protein